jgi:hypothetical protein
MGDAIAGDAGFYLKLLLIHHLFIYIAIPPRFARLKRFDHRVTGGVKVLCGMFVF